MSTATDPRTSSSQALCLGPTVMGHHPGAGSGALRSTDAAAKHLSKLLVQTEGEATLPGAKDQVFSVAYDTLRGIASRLMSAERAGHTLQPTALLNETYLRMVHLAGGTWETRGHFFRMAARTMRQILIDHARRKRAQKRGGAEPKVRLHDHNAISRDSAVDVLWLDEVLDRLAQKSPRMAQVVELRLFAGLAGHEIAEALGVSRKTICGDWQVACLWLRAELADEVPA
ncbi:MAG: ECF-type sigma factor [Candidatus Eisenbacteria bacterium]|uniref:Sigma-70 family RNA polymerase sigma factor n=1 Tax=Eiseniibacteriota bacterium TaxID=2212470 RepID=A0A956LZL9_UNCEI|nr:sigma-70 family RNA polymerase sigma factor [Candidatus Eisenbacteria bacterium]